MGSARNGRPKWARHTRTMSGSSVKPKPWWKSTITKVATAVFAIITAVVTAVATNVAQKFVGIDPSADPKASTRTSKNPTARGDANPPFTWTVHPLITPCEAPWVAPRSPEAIDSIAAGSFPENNQNWPAWPPAVDGASASPGRVEIFVKGKPGADVFLTGLHVEVRGRRPPLKGTVIGAPCGDISEFRWLDVNLDRSPTREIAHYDSDRAAGAPPQWGRHTPIRFPYRISASDSEAFLISARTTRNDCAWIAKLSWSSTNGASNTVTIDSHGAPFHTTSTRHLPSCNVITPCARQ